MEVVMEFEDLQKIWNSETNQHLYTINKTAMHNYIESKQMKARHIANFSEILLIVVNLITAGFIIGMNLLNPGRNLFLILMVIWMCITVLWVLANRIRRIKGDSRFDKSM